MGKRRKVVDDRQMGFVFTFIKKDAANAEQASKTQDSDAQKVAAAESSKSDAEKLKQLQQELLECRALENDSEKYPRGSEARKELLKRHAQTFDEIAKITDPNIFVERDKSKEKQIENKKRTKRKNNADSWEFARELRNKKFEIMELSDDELQKEYEEVIKHTPTLLLPIDKEVRLYRNEQRRRDELKRQQATGFTPTGKDITVVPNFVLNVISVSRHARRQKNMMRGKKDSERFFVEKQLFYKEYEMIVSENLKRKAFESVEYTGYEISLEEVLVFLALIKNTTQKQKDGENPWGILTCKKGNIIDFIGWEKGVSGTYYKKIIRCLDVLTYGTWKIESGENVYCGHLIADYYRSKEELCRKTGEVPENLPDLKHGEFYYRISPPLIALFKKCFFKANISAIRRFLHEDKRVNDLKAWFYLYLMSLYFDEEKGTQKVQGRHGMAKKAVMVPKYSKSIDLADIKERTGYIGALKELKRQMAAAVGSVSAYFAQNGGTFRAEWDRKHKYRLNVKAFKKPRLFDIEEEENWLDSHSDPREEEMHLLK